MARSLSDNIRNLKKKSLVGQVVVFLLGLQIYFLGSFVGLSLPTATRLNLERFGQSASATICAGLPFELRDRLYQRFPRLIQPVEAVRYSNYVPLAPLAVLVGYVLSLPLALFATLAYVLLGLFGPSFGVYLFAHGGGFAYWNQPGVGYLLGMIFASVLVGHLSSGERSSWRQILSVLGGILTVHAVGLSWLVGSSIVVLLLEGEQAYIQWQPYLFEHVRNLSWYAMPYDLFFALVLVALSFPTRALVNTLTAPDIAARPRARTQENISPAFTEVY